MASKAFSGPAGSSGAVTPTESTVTQDLPVVNTGPGNIDEDAHNRSSAEHIRARLADLDLPYTGPDQLGTLSTDRDCTMQHPGHRYPRSPRVVIETCVRKLFSMNLSMASQRIIWSPV